MGSFSVFADFMVSTTEAFGRQNRSWDRAALVTV
jgi:hypothetical protein